jgi:hypothetical protein
MRVPEVDACVVPVSYYTNNTSLHYYSKLHNLTYIPLGVWLSSRNDILAKAFGRR